MIKVILTAIGCPGGPSIIQSLRQDDDIYIIGTDMRENIMSKFIVDEFYQVPRGKSPEFIDALLQIAKDTNADVILPLATYELLALSQKKILFDDISCRICVSDYNDLLIANDRYLLYNKFKSLGFVPDYYILNNGSQIEDIAKKLGYPKKKIVIKPFISHGSLGLRVIDDTIDLYDQYRNYKPNNTIIPMRFAKLIFKDSDYSDILMTEYLTGPEYGIDMLINPENNMPIVSIIRNNGEVFHSEISDGRIVSNDEILGIALNIVKRLKLAYTINIDFKYDMNMMPKILEINPRLPATSYLAYSAGINLPLASIYLALGRKVNINIKNTDRRIFSYRGFVVVNNEGSVTDHSL